MDSRERVFLALNFQPPDRIPIDFWMSAGFEKKLLAGHASSVEQFLDDHDVDLRYIEGPAYIGPPLRTFPGGLDEDIWGVRRRTVSVSINGGIETYKEVADSPLATAATVEEMNAYDHWPSADWFDYSTIEAQCEKIRNRGRAVVFMGDRLNRISQLKPAMYLRGLEQIFMDMSLNPELAHAIFARIRNFYCEYARRIFEAARGKLDILLMGDDFGSQNGPLVSPSMWINFLRPGFADYIRIAKSFNLRVMHHTCGSVQPLVGLMADCGLDILQSLQPEALGMNLRELKSQFARRLAFHGGISIQRTMPFGSVKDIRDEVQTRIRDLASGGGYILCTSHNVQADTSLENVTTLFQAYNDFGKYPLFNG